ncbi:MAG: polymer-forming cytoskeletal protein [Xanthomonadales bacterium]|nr:polymer-forming cytoskeletal protein [Xanthomonadales bacterium]
MLGRDKNRSSGGTGDVETLIGPRVQISGDVSFSGGLYVEGTVQGSVVAEENGVLTLAENGRIEGEVRAPHVVISGQLIGDIHAGERVQLNSSARVQGNIYYKSVEMQAGAMITGGLIHADQPPRQLPRPEAVKDDESSGKSRKVEAA